MKKAVITILGTIGSKYDTTSKKIIFDDKLIKSHYYSKNIQKMLNKKLFTNTLPLLIDCYAKDYEIIPIYTELAKEIQEQVLREKENIDVDDIFKDEYKIIDENDFKTILSQVDTILNKYDKVIIDISHGFRHLPVLMTIDAIMQNIKTPQKIERILFAQEEIRPDKFEKIEGVYEIVDLQEYLGLASFAFVLANFKDNYTISSSVNTNNPKYRELLNAMKEFSRDILALSMNSFFHRSLPALKNAIDKVEDGFMLKNDLESLKEHLRAFDVQNKKRYEIYHNMATELMKKEYLLQAVNLIHEAKLTYLKTSFKAQSPSCNDIIEKAEKKIKNGSNKGSNTYKLLADCKYIYINDKFKPERLHNFSLKEADKLKEQITKDRTFREFLLNDLRNELAHADSDTQRENVKAEVASNIQKFKQLCIDNDVLNASKKI